MDKKIWETSEKLSWNNSSPRWLHETPHTDVKGSRHHWLKEIKCYTQKIWIFPRLGLIEIICNWRHWSHKAGDKLCMCHGLHVSICCVGPWKLAVGKMQLHIVTSRGIMWHLVSLYFIIPQFVNTPPSPVVCILHSMWIINVSKSPTLSFRLDCVGKGFREKEQVLKSRTTQTNEILIPVRSTEWRVICDKSVDGDH